MRAAAIGVLAAAASCAAQDYNGTCAAKTKCLLKKQCCQVLDDTYECCTGGEGCIPKVGCRCPAGEACDTWESFKSTHKKAYASATEESRRRGIFDANMRRAAELTAAGGGASFGASPFADLSEEEFKVYHNLQLRPQPGPVAPLYSPGDVAKALAASVDWREKGAVTPVKDQKQCGSCWAFSTVGNIEGQWFLSGHSLVSLSESELVECDYINGNLGCMGGDMYSAYQYYIKHGGYAEKDYPYTDGIGIQGLCKMKKMTAPLSIPEGGITGRTKIAKDEGQMLTWLQKNGPISIAVDANSHWQTYKSGIVKTCTGRSTDHGVLLVGYGESGSEKYWIVKNSWNTNWGEKGYIRLQYGTNQCDINSEATSAVIPSAGPAPPAPVRYHCDTDTKTCAVQAEGHSTMAKCQEACV